MPEDINEGGHLIHRLSLTDKFWKVDKFKKKVKKQL